MTATARRRHERHEAPASGCGREVRVSSSWRSLAQSWVWRLSKLRAPMRPTRLVDTHSLLCLHLLRVCDARGRSRLGRGGVVVTSSSHRRARSRVGDSVTWNFGVGDGHTTTRVSRASPTPGPRPRTAPRTAPGSQFTKRFSNTPGPAISTSASRTKTFMKGVHPGWHRHGHRHPLDNFKSKRTGNRVKLSFLLKEPATVTYKLTGQVTPDSEAAAASTPAGTAPLSRPPEAAAATGGVLTVVDDFDKTITPT